MCKFPVSQRIVASEIPNLLDSLPFPSYKLSGKSSMALKNFVYQRTTFQMSKKMDPMNPPDFYSYFGSITVNSEAIVFSALAAVVFEEHMQN